MYNIINIKLSSPIGINVTITLSKKCPYSEFFWSAFSRIFPHSHCIRRDIPYLSVFSPNAEKYGPEKLSIRTLFKHCYYHFISWQRSFTITIPHNIHTTARHSRCTIKISTNININISPLLLILLLLFHQLMITTITLHYIVHKSFLQYKIRSKNTTSDKLFQTLFVHLLSEIL